MLTHEIKQMLYRHFIDYRPVTRFALLHYKVHENVIDAALELKYIEKIDPAAIDGGPRYVITPSGIELRDSRN